MGLVRFYPSKADFSAFLCSNLLGFVYTSQQISPLIRKNQPINFAKVKLILLACSFGQSDFEANPL